jgi:hypothetical protein
MTNLAIETFSCRQPPGAARGDVRNLLQVAASALHLIERELHDDLRPLTRYGVDAIGRAAAVAATDLQMATPRFARSIP